MTSRSFAAGPLDTSSSENNLDSIESVRATIERCVVLENTECFIH